jgi:drug/metabolite transporter (DMT)-like permease
MNWLLIALINPVAHAIANHFDKYLISRFLKGGSVGTLILFSSLFAVVMLPILWIIEPGAFTSVSPVTALILAANGIGLVLAIICYLYALEIDEASYVVPLFQLIPVFGLFFGYIFLGEVLSSSQLWSGVIIMVGGTILSLEFLPGRTRFKKRLVLLMIGSSLFYAANAAVFKYVAVEMGFVNSLFWDMTGKFLFGIFLFAAIKSYRREFLELLRTNRATLIGLNSVNEVIGLVGEIALVLAVMYAPVALVQSVGSVQPLFVFIIGVMMTLFFPKFGQESLAKRHLVQKIIAIAIMAAGGYMLTQT